MRLRIFVVLAVAVSVGLATAVSPFASSSPDGLERVARDEGFLADGRAHPVQEDALAPGYAVPGIEDERLATGVAGFAGTLVTFAAGWALLALLGRSRRRVVT
jgi:cytochrome c peroxidase